MYPQVWNPRASFLLHIFVFLAGVYWTICGHLTKLDQGQSLSHCHSRLLQYLKLFLKVRANFLNREDVKFRDVSSLVLPCEPWSEENVSIESREWGRYAETKVSRERGIEGERGKEGGCPRYKFSIHSRCLWQEQTTPVGLAPWTATLFSDFHSLWFSCSIYKCVDIEVKYIFVLYSEYPAVSAEATHVESKMAWMHWRG